MFVVVHVKINIPPAPEFVLHYLHVAFLSHVLMVLIKVVTRGMSLDSVVLSLIST